MSPTMKFLLAGIVLILIVETSVKFGEAFLVIPSMRRALIAKEKANWINSDKYFHARMNYGASRRGQRGRWAARVISDAREWSQQKMGHGASDSAADQIVNSWGRNGGDPNVYRPKGLPKRY